MHIFEAASVACRTAGGWPWVGHGSAVDHPGRAPRIIRGTPPRPHPPRTTSKLRCAPQLHREGIGRWISEGFLSEAKIEHENENGEDA